MKEKMPCCITKVQGYHCNCKKEAKVSKSRSNMGLSAEQTPSYIIVFEDNDQRLEPFWDEAVAQARLDALGDNWSCHLYKLVESR